MLLSRSSNAALAVVVAASLFVCSTVQTTHAAMIATEQVLERHSAAQAKERLRSIVAREDVREVLVSWGVAPDEALARVEALTDAELVAVAPRLESLPAGGDGVGAVVGAVLLVFFVLLLTDILGLTNVFPFVNSSRR